MNGMSVDQPARRPAPVLPPARPSWVEVVGGLLVGGGAWFLLSGPRPLALLHGLVAALLLYLLRQAVGLGKRVQQFKKHGLGPGGWPFEALVESLRGEAVGSRTSREELTGAFRAQRQRYAQDLAVRWWCCTVLVFALPLLGLWVGWRNVDQYGDVLPPQQLLAPLPLSWLEATAVLGVTILLWIVGEWLLGRWEAAVAAVDVKSPILRRAAVLAAGISAGPTATGPAPPAPVPPLAFPPAVAAEVPPPAPAPAFPPAATAEFPPPAPPPAFPLAAAAEVPAEDGEPEEPVLDGPEENAAAGEEGQPQVQTDGLLAEENPLWQNLWEEEPLAGEQTAAGPAEDEPAPADEPPPADTPDTGPPRAPRLTTTPVERRAFLEQMKQREQRGGQS